MKHLLTHAVRRIGGLIVLAAAAAPVYAQCSMCRTALAASSEAAVRGFNLAIIVLLVPPVAIFVGIFAVGYRYRNDFNNTDRKQ